MSIKDNLDTIAEEIRRYPNNVVRRVFAKYNNKLSLILALGMGTMENRLRVNKEVLEILRNMKKKKYGVYRGKV